MAIFQPVQVFSKNIYVIDKNNNNNNKTHTTKTTIWKSDINGLRGSCVKKRNGTGLYHNHNIAVAVKRII